MNFSFKRVFMNSIFNDDSTLSNQSTVSACDFLAYLPLWKYFILYSFSSFKNKVFSQPNGSADKDAFCENLIARI